MKTINFYGTLEIGSVINLDDGSYKVIKNNINENGFNTLTLLPL